jgi:hypothetical protein
MGNSHRCEFVGSSDLARLRFSPYTLRMPLV